MDTDLLTVARQLAERGWLPGITDTSHRGLIRSFTTDDGNPALAEATEADLHLAAHNEIVRRRWA